MRMLALLHFHLGKEHSWGDCGHGHLPAFGAANAVENVLLVAGQKDTRERCKRRSDYVHAADQFIGPPIRVNFIDDHRQHLEGLRQRTCRQRETTLNVVEIQSVGLVLFFNFID